MFLNTLWFTFILLSIPIFLFFYIIIYFHVSTWSHTKEYNQYFLLRHFKNFSKKSYLVI